MPHVTDSAESVEFSSENYGSVTRNFTTNSHNAENGTHCHNDNNNGKLLDKKARKKLIIASILCLIFMLCEIIGGILANSLAVATDAAHLLTDFASFMISIVAIFMASRPATKKMSFGWYRAEVMGALISVLLIWVVTGILVYMAVQRVMSGDYEIDANVMLITSGLGVFFNIIMGCSLHDASHGHSHHGHSHGGLIKKSAQKNNSETASKIPLLSEAGEGAENRHIVTLEASDSGSNTYQKENINVRAAFIHVVGDFIQSIGILIAAFIIYYKPEWKIADPICTFFFSILVLITTITILRDTLNVLMEGMPHGIDFNDVKRSLCEIEGVRELHNMRIWSLTMNKTAVSVHLALDKGINAQKVLYKAGKMLKERYNMHECTIQIEEYVEEMGTCEQCQDPKD
ncbi:DgyrCDS4093 [Dimorphilus gyrociliatus]|uniref:DgyrCDS4093 n=1 Tax=Dimorphilus gyrociliatus TaxID=2664684 RepID=A0A7I8VFD6_9ANNE|nr:DgyrCDS4093 [Dimorphilus gyrociliatus]